ncbi:MAG: sulfatase-like hydrolase/transferase, partial [Myxococcota bacterium]
MRGLGPLGCACLALALPACGPSEPEPAKRLPNVLLVVVDTLRADRLEHLGSERGATPFLDELARGGTAFRRAYSTASWTPPAVASLFTSRLPVQHGIRRDDSVLAQAEVTLAERLTAAGYQTIGFSANLRIRVELGYGQGFDRWCTYIENPDGGTKPRAAQITSDALAWLERRPASEDRPVFLYLQ